MAPFTSSPFAAKYASILRALCHLSKDQGIAVLRKAASGLIKCKCECALNILNAVGEQEFANFLQKSTIPREFIGNTSLFNDGSDTPLTNLKRKYGRISRHFSDSAVTPSNLADPTLGGDEKESNNVEDCSKVFNETADSTLGYSTPSPKKTKPSWATLTLNT
ncbi:hypothetical protein QAD02_021799 [Eretmocerus hayati]|uniref:Uncharacterized protein n=1 Tax=Eretmocerus hayati TaxID=131215 RepID=A0ACC2PT72_9HYME|nr:hypothetical protein QAD02_021799 [Eretmocerus hayati]